jgi:hypothetical protein
MLQFLLTLFIVILVMLGSGPDALAGEALLCRTVEGHQVCVESIKRSAKNFWEYRAELTIDGATRPKERYDCRRTLRPSNSEESPSPRELQQLVCGLTRR